MKPVRGWLWRIPTLVASARQGWRTRTSLYARALLVAGVVCFSMGAADPDARFNDLGNKVMCTCGCQQILGKCDHVGCPMREEEMDEIRTGIAGGQNDSLILQSFVQRYGAVVLAAPTTEGFDLVAWIMPFAVSALALIGTIFLVMHWAKQQPALAAIQSNHTATKQEEELRERIRRETESI